MGSAGLTWSDTAGSITISDTGAGTKTFVGGGLTYNNLIIAGGGSGAVSITGANTFKDFSVGYPKQIIFQHGVQQTFVNPPVFAGIDNPTKIISGSTLNGDMDNWVNSTTPGSWTKGLAGSSTITQETSIVNTPGGSAAKLVTDSSGSLASISQGTVLTIGKRYKATLFTERTSGTDGLAVGDGTGIGYFIAIPTSLWLIYKGYFTATTISFNIKRANGASNTTIYVDDVTLEESTAIELSSDLAGSPATLSCPGKFNYLNYCSVKDIVGKSGEVWVAGNSNDAGGNTGILFYTVPTTLPLNFFHVDMSGGFGG